MADFALRVVVEKIDVTAPDTAISRDEISMIEIDKPEKIMELGLRHAEQIAILQKIQDAVLYEQVVNLTPEMTHCECCNNKLARDGYQQSKFHAVFTDHTVKLPKLKCRSCNKIISNSVKSLLGTSVHPDLYRLQCEHGADKTYRQAESDLSKMCNGKRAVNNHNRIKLNTNQVGEVLSERNKFTSEKNKLASAETLIVQVDGGHIKTNETEKRSIEVMSAKIYRPENVIEVTEKRSEIKERSCAASAKYDKQLTMKKYVKSAAEAQGLCATTHVTGLADGAKNCWGIIQSLQPDCKKLTCILDWFHLGKKMQPLIVSAPENIAAQLLTVKEHLWHGRSDEALALLEIFKSKEIKGCKRKINGLYTYLSRNKSYLVDYNSRAKNQQVYTSQVAESTVEHLINARQKRNQKMQWSRDGAHNVLQIRTMIASHRWDAEWEDVVMEAIEKAA